MRRSARSPWALLALPMLVGAVLLMHGLSGSAAASGSADAAAHEHSAEASAGHDDGHCADCQLGHVAAACVAVFAAIRTFTAVRRLRWPGAVSWGVRAPISWDRLWTYRLHPPEPAWVRLAVMRC